jgi:hypothetical protein
MPGAGYSGTPLAKKLGFREHARVCALDAPADYRDLLAPIPAGVAFVARPGKETDIVHVFVKERAVLVRRLDAILRATRPDASIWVSWPKKAAKVPTDITEDTIREVALPLGLVDVKVCAVDAVWSGLKLVIRKENR